VNHAVVVNESLFLEPCQIHIGVDEIHIAGRDDRDGVSAKEQFQNSQARNCKSSRVKN
jgi:hypothetical protein